ncbi:hypothetical protein [Alteromonas sp. H39]|uniref:hypothetical protein n=1 Tax=Alteromonas sp. H39 TaxID=3389876 RepID=UPI0039E19597
MYTLRSRPGTEHGRYEVASFKQVLTFSARGPWNDETLRRGSREMGEVINNLDLSKPWCQVSCLYGESLMQPSVYDYFVKQTAIRQKLGLSILAIVIVDSDISATIKRQLTTAYGSANIDHEFYNDIGSALAMLENAGFEVDFPNIKQFFAQNAFR